MDLFHSCRRVGTRPPVCVPARHLLTVGAFWARRVVPTGKTDLPETPSNIIALAVYQAQIAETISVQPAATFQPIPSELPRSCASAAKIKP
jgi:hypothetical protein